MAATTGPARGPTSYWTIPTRGDASRLGRRGWTTPGTVTTSTVTDLRPGRLTDFDHLVHVARGAAAAGFDGLLVPYDPDGEESWVVATALAREVPHLRVVPEFQPGFATAVYTAKLSLSFQRFFADRLGWKLALDTPTEAQRRVGDQLDGPQRLARARELLTIAEGVWHQSGYTLVGEHCEVEGGGLFDPSAVAGGFIRKPGRRRAPTIVLDGTSDEELELSAAFADLHLFDLDEPDVVAAQISRHREAAARHGRTVDYGVRLALLARPSDDEAWLAARRHWRRTTAGDDLEFDALVAGGARWQGFDQLGLAVHSGLVGSFDTVVAALETLRASGATTFVLDAVDHLGDVRRTGEFVLPRLRGTAPEPVGAGSAPSREALP